MSAKTLTVENSRHGIISEGTVLTVTREHENQFSQNGKKNITVETTEEIPNRLGSFQLFTTNEKETWTEIHVGLNREHEEITFVEEV